MAMIRSKGGVVLNKYLVARVFAFDDHDRRAAAPPRVTQGDGAAPDFSAGPDISGAPWEGCGCG